MPCHSTRDAVPCSIPPAFEWAQSPDSVFLNVKFAHKLDTPATLGCKATNVTIAPQSFTFVAECKSKRKVFELRFDPLKELDGEVRCTLAWWCAVPTRAHAHGSERVMPGAWRAAVAARRALGPWRLSGAPCSR